VPGEEQVEAGLEDDLVRRAGMRVGEGVARGVELGEEAPRNGDVHPAKVLGEGRDLSRGQSNHSKEGFNRLNHDRNVAGRRHRCPSRRRRHRRRSNLRHDVPQWRPLHRPDRSGQLASLAPGEVEESRKDLG
jgi:hypothetical protein